MRENLFEIGSNFSDDWSSDNREKAKKSKSREIREAKKHNLHFSKEKRRGKIVTIVKPFFLSETDMKKLLQALKKKLGTGGTIRNDSLEFQGEVKEVLKTQLEKLEYKLKL